MDSNTVNEARSRMNKRIRETLQEDGPQMRKDCQVFMRLNAAGVWVADWDKFNAALQLTVVRWAKLRRLELREREQQMCEMLEELAAWIDRTTHPGQLRKLLEIMDEMLPPFEAALQRYINLKTRKA